MESHASLLIQLVDIVVGAVRHAEARRRGYPQGTGTPKAMVADEVLALLVTGLVPSTRYHECMSATGRTDHHADHDLDAEQLLGLMPPDVLEALWPGFVPQDFEVFVNPINLRRHLQGSADFVDRVAALNQHAARLAGCLATAAVFVCYEKVASGEAGVTAYMSVPGARGVNEYLGIGMHLYPAKEGRRRRNHVTTLTPPISAKGLEARLKRQRHYRREDGPNGPPSVAE